VNGELDVDDDGERQAAGIGNILTVDNRLSYVDLVRFLVVMRGLDDSTTLACHLSTIALLMHSEPFWTHSP
jgi:hypothetical protein